MESKLKSCGKDLGFGVRCGEYSDIIGKKAYCSKCFGKNQVILHPELKYRLDWTKTQDE